MKNRQTDSFKRLLLPFGMALTALMAWPLLAEAATSNSTVSVDVNPVLTLSSSGTVTLGALTPDATGKQSIASDTIQTTTNDTAGVTITLADADATTTLASGGNTFTATSGTPASPVTLTNGTWGWRMDSVSGFGAGPTSAANNAAPSALTFAAMPATGSAFTIKTTSSTGSTSDSVWYSARANSSQATGTYTDTVTYTATAN